MTLTNNFRVRSDNKKQSATYDFGNFDAVFTGAFTNIFTGVSTDVFTSQFTDVFTDAFTDLFTDVSFLLDQSLCRFHTTRHSWHLRGYYFACNGIHTRAMNLHNKKNPNVLKLYC